MYYIFIILFYCHLKITNKNIDLPEFQGIHEYDIEIIRL